MFTATRAGRGRVPFAAALVAMLVTPMAVLADNCWNDCTIAATEWMNDTGATQEEAEIWFQGCLHGCQET